VAGIGERIEPQPPEPGEVLLVLPPFRLSTAAVFAALRPADWSAAAGAEETSDAEPGGNDLLAAALRLRPELAELQRRVASVAGREPRLSGSGPTLFIVDPDAERLDAVARRLAEEAAKLRVLRTRLAQRAASIEPVNHEEGTRA
jgi:4-diphosphocytidyl-2-C-methyl-D-erythritol kinase